MLRPPEEIHISVRTIGRPAADVVRRAIGGRVAAVFDSSFYVETDAGLVCIGSAALEPGPLTLVTDAPATTKWTASGISCDLPAHIGRHSIDVGNRYRYGLTGASEWSPAAAPGDPDPARIVSGLRLLRRIAADHAPSEGLGRFLRPGFRPGGDNAVGRAALDPVRALRRWLTAACRAPSAPDLATFERVRPLIGLGPGLTPSGDDMIGGVMIALHALRETAICHDLWTAMHQTAVRSGNAISLAHLRAAAEGQGAAALHHGLAAIMQADVTRTRDAVAELDRIGHTSGWDALAGVVMALDGWPAARQAQHCQ